MISIFQVRSYLNLEYPRTERNMLFGLLVWATLLQTLVIYFMPVSVSNDSWGYVEFARDLFESQVLQRTAGLPFLMALTGVPHAGTMVFFVFVQSLMAISWPFLIYFALRPFSRPIALLSAIVGASTLYPYFMAMQLLTELSFGWCMALLGFFLSRYFHTNRVSFLIYAVLAVFAIALLRVSGTAQFGCLMLVIAFAAVRAWWHKENWRRYASHGVLAILLFGVWHVGYGAISDRTSSKIVPFFVFNWVYRGGTEINYGIVSADNGPRTREMILALGEVIEGKPSLYNTLAQRGKNEDVKFIARTNSHFDEQDIHELLHDIMENNTDHLRGSMIPFEMAFSLGVPSAAKLLSGAIVEALIAHPEVLLKRLRSSYVSVRYATQPSPSPFYYVSSFWKQVPKPGVHPKAIGGPVFAEWVHGLNLVSGTDPVGREVYGHYPRSFAEAIEALRQHGNLTALGNYAVEMNTRFIVPVVWVVMLSGFVFGFWSRNPAVALGFVLIGTLPPFASVMISETDPRHFIMAYPVQVMAAGASIDGAVRLARRLAGFQTEKA